MRYANHYILKDLLMVLDSGDQERIKQEFWKYVGRYKEDNDLARIGSMALYAGLLRNGTLEDLKKSLKRMGEIRRLQTVKRCAELFSTRVSCR
jgi:hypothetical protein